MVRYVLVIGWALNGRLDQHAIGFFTSERNCWTRLGYINKGIGPRGPQYLGSCPSEEEFKKLYPKLKLEEDS